LQAASKPKDFKDGKDSHDLTLDGGRQDLANRHHRKRLGE
jgi:hypothetical protein